MRILRGLVLGAATLALLAGCGADDVASTGLHMSGTIAGPGGESGTLDVDVPEASSTSGLLHDATDGATGTITWSTGGTVPLTGSYDPATGALTLSGGGYSLTATIKDGQGGGSYTGPKGTGSFVVTAGSGVEVFCGTFDNDDHTSYGVWNLVRTGSQLGGTYHDDARNAGGIISGKMASDGVHFTLDDVGATGSIDGDSVSGTYANGHFEGSKSACK
jgi:hypothetical protein